MNASYDKVLTHLALALVSILSIHDQFQHYWCNQWSLDTGGCNNGVALKDKSRFVDSEVWMHFQMESQNDATALKYDELSE